MSDTVEPLIRDLLAWIAKEERSYADVMDAWRTSCPRLPVWEEASDRGFVTRRFDPSRGALIGLTEKGHAWLREPRKDLSG